MLLVAQSMSEPFHPAHEGSPLMRILHVVTLVDDKSSYGGPLTVAVNQCQELRRRGHDAQILAGWRGKGNPPDEVEGVPAHLFESTSSSPPCASPGSTHSRSLVGCDAKPVLTI